MAHAAPIWRRSLYARVVLMMVPIVGFLGAFVLVLLVVAFRVPGLFPGEASLRVVRFAAGEIGERFDDPAARGAIVAHLSREIDLDLTVVSPGGAVLESIGKRLNIPAPGELAAIDGDPVILAGLPPVAAAPIVTRGARRGVVIVHARNPLATRAPIRMFLVAGGALAVAFLIALPFARSIARPIERLARVAEAFGEGDLAARSGIASEDELGRLARSFDAMAGRIAALRRGERELLANAAHELRTPMSRIRVTLALVEADDPATRARVADVDAELGELDRLVSDVLLASRIDAGALELRREHLQARLLLARSVERATLLDPARSIEIDAADDLYLHVDEALFLRVLDNLLANAARYDTSGSPVRIEAREAAEIVIAIEDRGAGIEPGEAEQVFSAFTRGSAARGAAGGHGLGLALCKRIVAAHGGTIRALPRSDGERGARIELRLPTGVRR